MVMMAVVAAVSVFMIFSACGEHPVGPSEWKITQYTVTYDINDGIGTTPSSQTVNAGSSVTLSNGSDLTKDGFTFGGWNTNSSGTGTNYNAGSSITPKSNFALFARWNPVYTVTYDINDGIGTTPSSQTVNAGNSVTLSNRSGLTRTGFVFGGWNTNSSGTGTNYSAGSSFTPSSNITLYARWIGGVDGGTLSYGGQSYRTVIIGGKRWMAENLNYSGSGGNVGVCYNGSTSNCNTYGRLYTWAEAMSISSSYNSSIYGSGSNVQRGICPSGWRLPNDNDWAALTTAVGSNAGTKLKSQTGWNTSSGYGYIPGTDEFGFSALPGGASYTDGDFHGVGNYGHWWNTIELDDASRASFMAISSDGSGVGSGSGFKSSGFSVRCLQD